MKKINYDETPDSLEVTLDKEKSRFEFYGKSLPENSNEFFNPILEWFKEYIQEPNKETVVTFKLDYFNTSSSKKLLELFFLLQELHRQKRSVIINWYYQKEDDDMKESGEAFAEMVVIPFKIMSY
ncbi:MAG TPA: DUF1987 domain-containing protein [Williamwhitmania sp.]|nr:DUF1987 domain-containing protein [Williamwhitmania sp.]